MAHIKQVAEGLRLHWLLPIEASFTADIKLLGKSHKSLLAGDPVCSPLLQHCYLQYQLASISVTERKSSLDFWGVEF